MASHRDGLFGGSSINTSDQRRPVVSITAKVRTAWVILLMISTGMAPINLEMRSRLLEDQLCREGSNPQSMYSMHKQISVSTMNAP